MSEFDYDYFVIGAGSAGVRSARIASSHGAKVAIAERSALGGTCVNLGCVPKKIMAYGADYSGHLQDARGYGWDIPKNIDFDWHTLIANQQAEIARLNQAYEKTLTNAGVEILNGHKEETLYYYEHNWKVLRKMALAKDYIENYQLLITPVSEDNKIGIILMTTYTNQSQYEKREPHFEELIKEKGALNLMNDLKPNEFRKIVFSKENVIHHD